MTTKIKRSLVKTFLNTGTVLSPTWVLVGDGVKSGKFEYKPKTTEETYITDDSATLTLDSYAPTMPIDMICNNGDAVFEYMDALRKARSVLSDTETEVVNVWLYKTPANGYYYAEKQAVSIQIDSFGGDGGSSATIAYTFNFLGDPILGVFKPAATATFAANPVTTTLTTLVLGSGTLSPLFATNKANLLYTTSIAAATVTMASTLSGATIVQKDNVDGTVSQGAAATLSMGLNHLKVQVTVGSEVVTYLIDATRTV